MWKGKKFIVIAALIAGVLVAGTTGIVLAQDGDDSTGTHPALLARVAQILNIDQQKLEDAFKQAMSEKREQLKETFDQKLQDMVTEGKITQQQLNEFKAWQEAKPGIPMVGPRGLKKLLDEGKITQEQLDAFKAWLKARPDIPLPRPDRFKGMPQGSFFGPPQEAPEPEPTTM